MYVIILYCNIGTHIFIFFFFFVKINYNTERSKYYILTLLQNVWSSYYVVCNFDHSVYVIYERINVRGKCIVNKPVVVELLIIFLSFYN